jgi:hypothetical protein
MKHCTDVFLVGLDHELPTDPRIGYFGTGKPPWIGCNNLVCLKCKQLVRHVDGRSTTRAYLAPATLDAQELYASPDPASSPLLDARPMNAKSRVYYCRCDLSVASLGGVQALRFLDQEWECGGHPE